MVRRGGRAGGDDGGRIGDLFDRLQNGETRAVSAAGLITATALGAAAATAASAAAVPLPPRAPPRRLAPPPPPPFITFGWSSKCTPALGWLLALETARRALATLVLMRSFASSRRREVTASQVAFFSSIVRMAAIVGSKSDTPAKDERRALTWRSSSRLCPAADSFVKTSSRSATWSAR